MPQVRVEPLPLLVAALALALAGCGEKQEPGPAAPTAGSGPQAPASRTGPGAGGDANGSGPSQAERAAARRLAIEHRIEHTVREYVARLDARDGEQVCDVLAPGVIEKLTLPRERGSCAASLNASIGYRDPRGLPQFAGVELDGIRAIDVNGRSARAIAEIVTTFADRDEPSLEDDVVYLEHSREGWLVAKASAALYRAIGAEPGPEAIAPPG